MAFFDISYMEVFLRFVVAQVIISGWSANTFFVMCHNPVEKWFITVHRIRENHIKNDFFLSVS